MAAAFDNDTALGVALLVLAPLLFLLMAFYARVLLEFVVVVFRIYENTSVPGGSAPARGALDHPGRGAGVTRAGPVRAPASSAVGRSFA